MTAWYSAIFILSSVVLFASAYALLASSLRKQDRDTLRLEGQELAHHYEAGGLDAVRLAVGALRPGSFLVRLAGPRHDTLWLDGPEQWRPFDLDALTRGPASGWIRVPARDDDAHLEVLGLTLADGVLLQVGKSTEARDTALERFRGVFGATMIPIVLLGAVGGSLLARRALRPIRHLITTVRAIESGALDARVPTGQTGDELDDLGTLINGMLDRIERLLAGMRGALDNVAHDLRTPLTRLRGTAEMALRGDRGLDACRDALADCVEEAEQLLTMLTTLMDISEAQTGTLALTRELVNVGALVASALALYELVADEQGVVVTMRVPTDLWLLADGTRLRQVLANLLDNALKYTPFGGRVEVTAAGGPQVVVIRVQDTGIGMRPDELPRVWERLYRGEASRGPRGLGLGLSLVKAIVEAHRGHVEVSSTLGGGSIFSVSLPQTGGPPEAAVPRGTL